MTYAFTFTPRFQKHFKNLTVLEKKQLKNKLQLLAENPSHPSLRTKHIQGTTDLFECSVNMDIRVIWYYEGNGAAHGDLSGNLFHGVNIRTRIVILHLKNLHFFPALPDSRSDSL